MRQIRQTTLAILLLLTVLLTGCAGGGDMNSAGATRAVTDCVGRTVNVPEHPQRVICMYASTAHMMAMLDEGDKIVGAADGVTRDQMMITKYPSIEDVPTPYHEGAVNVEEVMALDPDLIIIKTEMYLKEAEQEKLDNTGVPYLVVDYDSIASLKKALTVMGEAFGKSEQAQKYIAFMEQTLDTVKGRLSDVPEAQRPRVFHSVTEATKTDIVDSLCSEIISTAGLIDVSAAAGVTDLGKNATVTLEQIYAWDPDAFLCNEYAVADYIQANPKWSGLKAVQNKAVYTLPIGATRWCHHGSMEPQMGALFLAKTFWPDKFTDYEWKTVIRDYYAEYFGMSLDDATIDKILSGHGMRESSPTLEME
ncbi:MAG: ABC transporter substrate-binding protein [Clostridia bacterium]|nr:ABC transporter substrate-binding protein [Clostridia bacterium]